MENRQENLTMGERYEFIPLLPKEFLGKRSYVNYCLNNLGVSVIDHDREVVFLRVLRTGSQVVKGHLAPGHLVAVYGDTGRKVYDPSAAMEHYIVKVKYIIALINKL